MADPRMLRILPTVSSSQETSVVRVRLVGQVSGEWVTELRRLSTEILSGTNRLEFDMAEVSFVDAEGLRLFQDLVGPHVGVVNCALFVAEQLRTLELDV